MSWSRSSRLGLAVLLLLALIAAVGVASAVSVTQEEAPEEAEVGQQVTITVELQDLYAEQSSWNFDGVTRLQNATWTVEQYQGDTQVASDTFQAQSPPNGEVTIDQSASDAPDRIVVEITGTVPAVDEYSYANPATFNGAELARVDDGGPTIIAEYPIHHYTTGDPGSQGARAALDDASATIQAAAANGSDVSQAESTFEDAVSAYDSGNFGEAVSLAGDAASQAQSSGSGSGSSSDDGSSSDGAGSDGSGTDSGGQGGTNQSDSSSDGGSAGDGSGSSGDDGSGTSDGSGSDGGNASSAGDSDDGGLLMVILYGVLGLLILGAVGGGVYWYQQQNQGPSRDPLG